MLLPVKANFKAWSNNSRNSSRPNKDLTFTRSRAESITRIRHNEPERWMSGLLLMRNIFPVNCGLFNKRRKQTKPPQAHRAKSHQRQPQRNQKRQPDAAPEFQRPQSDAAAPEPKRHAERVEGQKHLPPRWRRLRIAGAIGQPAPFRDAQSPKEQEMQRHPP